MALLFDEDYEILTASGLNYIEDESQRFLIIENYPAPEGLYVSNELPIKTVEILVVIPTNYNTSGTDMLWTYPHLLRTDGKAIPNTSIVNGDDPRFYGEKQYCRWSRHFTPESWAPKTDNVQKILSRIEWALRNPDADQK